VRTGLALANPSAQDVEISFFFTDGNGLKSRAVYTRSLQIVKSRHFWTRAHSTVLPLSEEPLPLRHRLLSVPQAQEQ
jgi:hypothetical protein